MQENYHTHTYRCHHAIGTEEDYIRNAIDSGLSVLGFSDHTPFPFPNGYCSHIRMLPEQISEYAQSILTLRKKYAGQIDIRLGLETEYYPDRMKDLLNLIEDCGIEYMLLGQHWCGNEENEPYNGHLTNDRNHLRRYCAQVIEAMQTGLFSYLAHPDLMHFTGDDAYYRAQMEQLCCAAKELNIPVEINLQGILTNRHYPNDVFWQIAGEVGCKVVLGSDAHKPQDVVMPQAEATALEMVRKYKLQLLEQVPIHPWQDGKLRF